MGLNKIYAVVITLVEFMKCKVTELKHLLLRDEF